MRSPARPFLLLLCGLAVPADSLSAAESRHRKGRRSHKAAESWPKATADPQAGTGAVFAKPVVLGTNKKNVMMHRPSRPGCWMRIPSGCPNDPMDTRKWRHDTWAEREGLDEAGCLQRVNIWKGYCGSGDVMMAFVAQETRSEPFSALQISAVQSWPWTRKKTQEAPEKAEQVALPADKEGTVKGPRRPGCWMRMPSGCPKRPMQTQQWRRDTWAEQQGVDQAGCQQRAAMWNKLCDSQDAVMAFVANETPSEALVANETSTMAFGASVANETPSEAPAANETPSEQWLVDPWSKGAWSDPTPGADPPLSALQASATESWPWSRKKAPEVALAGGGAAESEQAPSGRVAGLLRERSQLEEQLAQARLEERRATARLAELAQRPSGPGCWFWMPTDCRGRGPGVSAPMPSEDAVHGTTDEATQSQPWNHDAWAERQGVDEAGCQTRAAVWNSFCHSQNVVMAFVPESSFPPFVPA